MSEMHAQRTAKQHHMLIGFPVSGCELLSLANTFADGFVIYLRSHSSHIYCPTNLSTGDQGRNEGLTCTVPRLSWGSLSQLQRSVSYGVAKPGCRRVGSYEASRVEYLRLHPINRGCEYVTMVACIWESILSEVGSSEV